MTADPSPPTPSSSAQRAAAPPASAAPPRGAAASPGAASPGAASPPVRASDADRDQIAEILRDALAEGRLDAEEHAERIEAAYRAKTVAQLAELIGDLPAGQRRAAAEEARAAGARGPAGAAGDGVGRVVAVLSGASRQGRWWVPARVNAVAVCGGVDLDLTEAMFEQRYVVVNVVAVCGGVDIKVPENVSLRNAGSGVMGGFDVRESESLDPGAPVVTVQGVALFGGVEARPVAGKRVRDLRVP